MSPIPAQAAIVNGENNKGKRRRKRRLPLFVLLTSAAIAALIIRNGHGQLIGQAALSADSPTAQIPATHILFPQPSQTASVEPQSDASPDLIATGPAQTPKTGTRETNTDKDQREPTQKDAQTNPHGQDPAVQDTGLKSPHQDDTAFGLVPLPIPVPIAPLFAPPENSGNTPTPSNKADAPPSPNGGEDGEPERDDSEDDNERDEESESQREEGEGENNDNRGRTPIPLPLPVPLPRPIPTPLPLPVPLPTPSPTPAPLPIPAAPPAPEPTPRPHPGGNYYVQIHATPHEHSICEIWSRIKQSYPDLFAHAEQSVSRLDKADGSVWFRLRVGAFDTAESANAFCARLRTDGHDCFTVPRHQTGP